jgi:hypothetical protein
MEEFIQQQLQHFSHRKANVDRCVCSRLSPWIRVGSVSVRLIYYKVTSTASGVAAYNVADSFTNMGVLVSWHIVECCGSPAVLAASAENASPTRGQGQCGLLCVQQAQPVDTHWQRQRTMHLLQGVVPKSAHSLRCCCLQRPVSISSWAYLVSLSVRHICYEARSRCAGYNVSGICLQDWVCLCDGSSGHGVVNRRRSV